MNKQALLLVIILSLSMIAATTEPPVCITPEGCWDGYQSIEACQDDFPEYTTNILYQVDNQNYCQEGCCQLEEGNSQMTSYACQYYGGTFYPGESCSGVEIIQPPEEPGDACEEGGTDCFCEEADQNIEESDGICCLDGIQDGDTCEYTSTGPNPGNETCTQGEDCNEAPPACSSEADITLEITAHHIPREKAIRMTHEFTGIDCSEEITDFTYRWNEVGRAATSSVSVDPQEPNNVLAGNSLKPETEYFIELTAQFEDAGIVLANTTFTLGEALCFSTLDSYCLDASTAIECTNENEAQKTSCTDSGTSCVYIEEGAGNSGKAICAATPPCEECNAAFENYASTRLSQEVSWETNSGTALINCGTLSERFVYQGERYGLCSYDYNKGSLRQLVSCSEISSCAQYNSQEACDANTCLTSTTCAWDQGANACQPEDESVDCSINDPDPESCEAIDGCGFDGEECKPQEELTCEDLVTRDQCLGDGQSFQRNSETNAYLFESQNDYYPHLNKCSWRLESCVKRDNIEEQNYVLETDFTNPQTTLLIGGKTVFSPGEQISFSASDADSTIDYTMVSINQGVCAETTRPTTEISTNIIELPTDTSNGNQFCIHYYSKDSAGNFEFVQQQDIIISNNPLTVQTQALQYPLLNGLTDVYIDISGNRPLDCTVTDKAGQEEPYVGFGVGYDKTAHLPKYTLSPKKYNFEYSCTSELGDAQGEIAFEVYPTELELSIETTMSRIDESNERAQFDVALNYPSTCSVEVGGQTTQVLDQESEKTLYFQVPVGEHEFTFTCRGPEQATQELYAEQVITVSAVGGTLREDFSFQAPYVSETTKNYTSSFNLDQEATCTMSRGGQTAELGTGTEFNTEPQIVGLGEHTFSYDCQPEAQGVNPSTWEQTIEVYPQNLEMEVSTSQESISDEQDQITLDIQLNMDSVCTVRSAGSQEQTLSPAASEHTTSFEKSVGDHTFSITCESITGKQASTTKGPITVLPGTLREQFSTSTSRIPTTNNIRFSSSFTLDFPATCTYTNQEETIELNGGEPGQDFSTPQEELSRGQYQFSYSCQAPGVQGVSWEHTETVDLGTVIREISPAMTTYRAQEANTISLYANPGDTCQYERGGWNELQETDNQQNFSIDGEDQQLLQYTAPIQVTQTGFYKIPVRCREEAIAPWVENNAYFAIDEQAPNIQITLAEETISGGVVDVEDEVSVEITCEDPEIVGIPEEQEGNFQAGFDEMRIDDSVTDGNTYTHTFELFDDPIQITCSDSLGNSRTRSLEPRTNDLTGPQRPTFRAVNQ